MKLWICLILSISLQGFAISDCTVQTVENGHLVERKIGAEQWSWRKFEFEKPEYFEKIPIGTVVLGEAPDVFLQCETGNFFNGEGPSRIPLNCSRDAFTPEPVCLPRKCNLKDLSISQGVSFSETPVLTYSGQLLHAVCIEGYSIRSHAVKCFNGKWAAASTSPCQENDCIVPAVEHGHLEERKFGEERWSWTRFKTIRPEYFEKVPVNSALKSGSKNIFLRCDPGYSCSRKKKIRKLLYCVQGVWYPELLCIPNAVGCDAIRKPFDSRLIIQPVKDKYLFGEFVSFSCPSGMRLTSDVEKVVCLWSGWSEPTLPDCEAKTAEWRKWH